MITENIIEFLIRRKWRVGGNNDNYTTLLPPGMYHLPQNYKLTIPNDLDENKLDREIYLNNLYEVLSGFFNLKVSDIKNLIEQESTILKIRIHGAETNGGKISFKKFEELIEKLKSLFTNTATFASHQGIVSEKQTPEAIKYTSLCQILASEQGSFITNVQLPSKEPLCEPTIFDPLPLSSEDVNNKLEKILSFVNDKIFNDDQVSINDKFLFDNKENLNLNILKDIRNLYDKTDLSNIDFSFHNINYSSFVTTENISGNKLQRLVQFVDDIEKLTYNTQTTTIRGKILGLTSRDPDGMRNNVKVGAVYEGSQVTVTMYLSSLEYMAAIEAHRSKRYINIVGLAKKTKDKIKFIQVDSFVVE